MQAIAKFKNAIKNGAAVLTGVGALNAVSCAGPDHPYYSQQQGAPNERRVVAYTEAGKPLFNAPPPGRGAVAQPPVSVAPQPSSLPSMPSLNGAYFMRSPTSTGNVYLTPEQQSQLIMRDEYRRDNNADMLFRFLLNKAYNNN